MKISITGLEMPGCNVIVELNDGYGSIRSYTIHLASKTILHRAGQHGLVRKKILGEDDINISLCKILHIPCVGQGDAGAIHGTVVSVKIVQA